MPNGCGLILKNQYFLEFSSLRSFLDRNSESPIYRTHRRFCYLRVSYPAIFRTCERFSRQF